MDADVVMTGGQIYLDDARANWARALAITAGRISAIGGDDDIGALARPRTTVVDLAGATVLPGFIDAHVHPLSGGMGLLDCDLSGYDTKEDYLRVIGEHAKGLPAGAWVRGSGWSMPAFERGVPDAAALDAVIGDRPALLYNRDTHSAWVSTAALRLAGIDDETPDPAGGRIERDESGRPAGALHETAMTLVARLLPPPTKERRADALRAGQRYLHRLGITEWQDAKVLDDDIAAYEALAGSGELTSRVVGAFWLDPARGPEQVAEIIERRAALRRDLFELTSVKIMLDGVCETHTAALSAPYLDGHGHATGNTGISFFDPENLHTCARLLDDAGFQLHFHAVGDAAVTQALDTVARVRAGRGPSPNRPHVAHVQVVAPADITRFRALGVSVNAQPLWARLEPQMTALTLPFLGPERSAWQYPFGDMESAGATLAFGSDWPVSTPDPIRQIHVAVNRTPVPDRTRWTPADGTFLPDQRLSLPAAIRAFTRGSAYLNRHEDISGSIAVGKSADLAVLDSNPFDRPRADIWRSHVVQTWFAGTCVHDETGEISA